MHSFLSLSLSFWIRIPCARSLCLSSSFLPLLIPLFALLSPPLFPPPAWPCSGQLRSAYCLDPLPFAPPAVVPGPPSWVTGAHCLRLGWEASRHLLTRGSSLPFSSSSVCISCISNGGIPDHSSFSPWHPFSLP